MKLTQADALRLESIVRSVIKCDRYGFGGLVDADIYFKYPLEAAIECVTFLYNSKSDELVGDNVAAFFRKWRYADDGMTIDEYISDLKSIIDMLK